MVISNKKIFKEHREAMMQMTYGDTLLTSNKDKLVEFKIYCLHTFLHVSSNAQVCESVTKDTAHVKKRGRDEDATLLIAMPRYCMISELAFMTKNDSYFKNFLRKK